MSVDVDEILADSDLTEEVIRGAIRRGMAPGLVARIGAALAGELLSSAFSGGDFAGVVRTPLAPHVEGDCELCACYEHATSSAAPLAGCPNPFCCAPLDDVDFAEEGIATWSATVAQKYMTATCHRCGQKVALVPTPVRYDANHDVWAFGAERESVDEIQERIWDASDRAKIGRYRLASALNEILTGYAGPRPAEAWLSELDALLETTEIVDGY